MSNSSAASGLSYVKDVYRRFGPVRTIRILINRLLNSVATIECLHIIYLDREDLKPLTPEQASRYRSKIATTEDISNLAKDPAWDITPAKLRNLKNGDVCVLSMVGDQYAGYTWVHTEGRPELMPGLTISVPDNILYNYAGLTLPKFRGSGLQTFRHHSVLNNNLWLDRQGMVGYVKSTNFASQNGQTKSGYKVIGKIWLVGTKRSFYCRLSASLGAMGICKLSPDRRLPYGLSK